MASVPFTMRLFAPESAPFQAIDHLFFTSTPPGPAPSWKGVRNVTPIYNNNSTIITLSNGARYDTNQIYDLPKILEGVVVTWIVSSRTVLANDIIEESYSLANRARGRRGILFGIIKPPSAPQVDVSALGRLISVERNIVGGTLYDRGRDAGQAHHVIELNLTFDMLAEFS